MKPVLPLPPDYGDWLASLKSRIQGARQRALLSANAEQIQLYHDIGRDILERQSREGWGAKVIEQLSTDLRAAFPDMKGLSSRNLKYMKFFAEHCPARRFRQQIAAQIDSPQIGQQSAAQLLAAPRHGQQTADQLVSPPSIGTTLPDQLPWFHIVTLLTKLSDPALREWYAQQAIQHSWPRDTLTVQIKNQLHLRQGLAVTNFDQRLAPPQAGLAAEILKDPYHFDFLGLGDEAHERDIENALIRHITRFLLELGAGFAFVGRQFQLVVGGDEFFLDLLFYHTRLKCYVVVELKAQAFKPEHAGQLNFYLSAVDAQVKAPDDKPTIGLLLCKTQNRLVAEYALSGIDKPIGVAEYQLVRALPEPLDTSLPSIEEIEAELSRDLPKEDATS
jgi:predicted nuclease of restriction endonuclease-like (RecB) superfamily